MGVASRCSPTTRNISSVLSVRLLLELCLPRSIPLPPPLYSNSSVYLASKAEHVALSFLSIPVFANLARRKIYVEEGWLGATVASTCGLLLSLCVFSRLCMISIAFYNIFHLHALLLFIYFSPSKTRLYSSDCFFDM